MFYSKSTGGFYSIEIHGKNIPGDAVEITAEDHATLMDGQSAGKQIAADANGYPVLSEKPAPTAEQLATAIRTERDARMAAFQWRLDRYAGETRLGLTPTDDIAGLDGYMQALRDVTKQSTFPATVIWPDIPE